MTLIPWQNGKCVAWDVTVADTFATSYIQQTATSAGAAAERAALNKRTKYDHFKNNYIFIPHACEVIGAWSADTALPFLMNSPTKFVQSHAMTKKEISFIRDFLSRYRETMLLVCNVVLLMVVLMLTLA